MARMQKGSKRTERGVAHEVKRGSRKAGNKVKGTLDKTMSGIKDVWEDIKK